MKRPFQVLWYLLGVLIIVGIMSCNRSNDNDTDQDLLTFPETTTRFFNNGDGTITDTTTGLVWLKNANCFRAGDHEYAEEVTAELAHSKCGLGDESQPGQWRLPHVKELLDLLDYSLNPVLSTQFPFENIVENWYWTLTTETDKAWVVHLGNGDTGLPNDSTIRNILAVKGPLYVTLSAFVDNSDGTVTDTITGLTWLKNANCFGKLAQEKAARTVATWLENGTCGLNDGSKIGDWRLPTITEMIDILDYSQNPTLPRPPFENVATYYWTQSPFVPDRSRVWIVYLSTGPLGYRGDLGADPGTTPGYILPIRKH